jgi:hypothetical protein
MQDRSNDCLLPFPVDLLFISLPFKRSCI